MAEINVLGFLFRRRIGLNCRQSSRRNRRSSCPALYALFTVVQTDLLGRVDPVALGFSGADVGAPPRGVGISRLPFEGQEAPLGSGRHLRAL